MYYLEFSRSSLHGLYFLLILLFSRCWISKGQILINPRGPSRLFDQNCRYIMSPAKTTQLQEIKKASKTASYWYWLSCFPVSLQPTPHQQVRSRHSAYKSTENEGIRNFLSPFFKFLMLFSRIFLHYHLNWTWDIPFLNVRWEQSCCWGCDPGRYSQWRGKQEWSVNFSLRIFPSETSAICYFKFCVKGYISCFYSRENKSCRLF